MNRQIRSGPRRLARFFLPLLICIALAVATTTIAQAAYRWGYGYDGVNIRQCAYTSCTSNGLGYSSQLACELNQQQGETINGNPWWLQHTNLSTSVQGWSAQYYMYLDYPNLC